MGISFTAKPQPRHYLDPISREEKLKAKDNPLLQAKMIREQMERDYGEPGLLQPKGILIAY